jgi:multidrug efflux system membrane fusion protein
VRLAVEGKARFAEVRIVGDEIDGVWVTGLPPSASVIVVGQEFVRDGRSIMPTSVDPAVIQ